MHLAVYAATQAGAVVHTHSPEVIALSAVSDELPAIHYAITGLGGPVRVAAYTRFGSDGLARAAVDALDGRRAAILQNHGAICYGATLAEAYDRALLLEWLAHVHRLACARGTPRILPRRSWPRSRPRSAAAATARRGAAGRRGRRPGDEEDERQAGGPGRAGGSGPRAYRPGTMGSFHERSPARMAANTTTPLHSRLA